MQWYFILIIVLGFILINYIIFIMFFYHNIFWRGTNKPFTEQNLENTHYAPYLDILYRDMEYMNNLKYKEESISVNGVRLYGRYFDNHGDKMVLMMHGYRATPYNNFSVIARAFLEHGYNVFFAYQRANDNCGGHHVTFGYKEAEDCTRWIYYLSLKYNQEIILYGTSMGAATVVRAAGLNDFEHVRVVVADCGYKTSYDAIKRAMMQRKLPYKIILPCINIYARIMGFNLKKNQPVDVVDKINKPIVFIHSRHDHINACEWTIDLYNKANEPKLLLIGENGGHTATFMANREEIEDKLFNFIKENSN